MHSYLRAIGFSKLEQKDLDQILQGVIVSCDEKKIAEQGKNEIFAELSRYFGMNIGLRVCGTYDEQDQFRMEYYFPYFAGVRYAVFARRHADRDRVKSFRRTEPY